MTIEAAQGDANEALWEAPPEARPSGRAPLQERWNAVGGALDPSTQREFFTALYLDEVDALVRHARRMGHPAPEAQQLAQDSFVVLWNKLPEYDPRRAKIRTWLWGIHTKLEVGARRLAIRRSRWNVGPVDPEDSPAPGTTADPERRLIARDTLARAERVLAALPPKLREVWVLQRIDGFTLVEVAAVLGEELTVVTGRLRQADHALRAKLDEAEPKDGRLALIPLSLGSSADVLPSLVERLRRIDPLSPAERERLLRRIEESLGVRLPRPPGVHLRRWLPALGSHGAIAALSATLAATVLRRPEAPSPRPVTAVTMMASASGTATDAVVTSPADWRAPLTPPVATPTAPAATPEPAIASAPRTRAQVVRATRSEATSYERYRQAQHALATNPDLTLRAVQDERSAQGGRGLSPDWVLLEVQVLVRQGQRQAALTQARRFADTHPGDSLANDIWRAAGVDPPRDG